MPDVQATIQLLVDFHMHDQGTMKLASLDALSRESFLTSCADALHGGRIDDFIALHRSATFRPMLGLEPGTSHPSLARMNQALVTALVDYNEQAFGLTFDQTVLDAMDGSQVAVPPYSCVQWIWVVDHWVAKYNYDLVVTAGRLPTQATPMGLLTAAYRVALLYP